MKKITNKEIAREIGKDIGKSAKKGLKGLGKVVVNAGYSVLGNLSANVQGILENRLGTEVYDPKKAYGLSRKVNAIGYIAGGSIAGASIAIKAEGSPIDSVMGGLCGALIGGYCAFSEYVLRLGICEDNDLEYCGSLWGKALSLPIDIPTYIGNKSRGYLSKIEQRIEPKKSLENKLDNGENE